MWLPEIHEDSQYGSVYVPTNEIGVWMLYCKICTRVENEEEGEEELPDPVLRIGARSQRGHRRGPGVVTAGPFGKGEPPFHPSIRTAQAPPRGGGDSLAWTVINVGPFMWQQSRLLGECFTTNFAHVWPLTGVGPFMFQQIRSSVESFTANFAHVWTLTSVDLFMWQQSRLLGECFTANFAHVWTLTSVDYLMSLHHIDIAECLLTNVAHCSFFFLSEVRSLRLYLKRLVLGRQRVVRIATSANHWIGRRSKVPFFSFQIERGKVLQKRFQPWLWQEGNWSDKVTFLVRHTMMRKTRTSLASCRRPHS